MQPVNVLPTFVSQDTDSKTKDTSKSSDDSTDFSSLVDKHVESGAKNTTNKESATADEPAATTRNSQANNGNNKDKTSSRQESDSSTNTAINKSTVDNKADVKDDFNSQAAEILAKQTKEGDNSEANKATVDDETLAESEQFISLLYNSDQTLTKTTENTEQVDKDKQTADTASNTKSDPASSSSKEGVVASSDDEAMTRDKNNSVQASEHRLKAFSKDELLARAQLRNTSAEMQQSSSQVLKDYQLSLQSQQNVKGSGSITSDQLSNSQLAIAQLKNDEVTEIPPSANKAQLKEVSDSGHYQPPVEPIGKGKPVQDDLSTADKDTSKEVKSDSVTNPAIASEDESTQSDSESNAEQENSPSKEVSTSKDVSSNKANGSDVKSEVTHTQSSKVNGDKVVVDVTANGVNNQEASPEEQASDNKMSNAVVNKSQKAELQQSKAQQQSQAVTRDLSSSDSDVSSETVSDEAISEEHAYVDSMPLSQEKPKASNGNTKATDNIATRSVSESQTQAIQVSQAKQNNDAYIEHQSSEVLNHNVATDTAQIQKNNVQLQQETISIFKKDFADAVKDKVMIMINQKLQQFDITLDPPEFGNMQVRVNLQGEQAAVNFVVQNQQAKEALEQNMHKLKEMLAEQGVDVGGSNVEQQNQQKDNDDGSPAEGSNMSSHKTRQGEEEQDAKQLLSAQLFDSSPTGVDYYA